MKSDRGAFIVINCDPSDVPRIRRHLTDQTQEEGIDIGHIVVKEKWLNSQCRGRLWGRMYQLYHDCVEAFTNYDWPVSSEERPCPTLRATVNDPGEHPRVLRYTTTSVEEVAGKYRIVKVTEYVNPGGKVVKETYSIEDTDLVDRVVVYGYTSFDHARRRMARMILADAGLEDMAEGLTGKTS